MTMFTSPKDPPVFTHKPGTIPGLLMVAEHAGSSIPANLHNLGCDLDFSSVHFGCDIGVAALMDIFNTLGAETFVGNYSRAVIDPNRMEDDPTLIPPLQDGIIIPANVGISEEDKEARIAAFYRPYHQKLQELVNHHLKQTPEMLYISVHSMENRLEIDSIGNRTDGAIRPRIALLFKDRENDLAEAFADFFRAQGINDIGMNVPYTAKDEARPMPMFAWHQPRLPLIMIEFRNDLLRTQEDIQTHAALLMKAIAHVTGKAVSTLKHPEELHPIL